MSPNPILHHFEVCVRNETYMLNLLVKQFGFNTWQQRTTLNGKQWALKSEHSIFIITKRTNTQCKGGLSPDQYPLLFCCSTVTETHNDSVFNTALQVKNVHSVTDAIRRKGGTILHEPDTVHDQHGTLIFSVVKSVCDNVMHTLLDTSKYTGFLPGFVASTSTLNTHWIGTVNRCKVQYFDHVTFVCEIGQSGPMIEWYEQCFGMRRFIANREETIEDGFVIAGSIGLRLKALQYWQCAESGVGPPEKGNDPTQLKIVIAEPIAGVETSHVRTFLRQNRGPGIQHIGLYSHSILESVWHMKERGAQFRMPPFTYYQDFGKEAEVHQIGLPEGLSSLSKLGILLDFEPADDHDSTENWLMQIFTYPVFDKDTFFLEVIQRDGAQGFGSGNITALARSIVRYQQELTKQKSL